MARLLRCHPFAVPPRTTVIVIECAMTTHDRFLTLLEEHKRILYKLSYVYCRDPEDRNDLIQEMTIQLWRSFERYDERYRFSTWMYRVVLNVAISFYRSERRRTQRVLQLDTPILELAAPEPDPDQMQLVRRAIEGLDPLNKALMMLYLDDNSYETIAEILGISVTNVATKISRLKQRLRRDLAADQ
jgi:RNA polymerase sigma factor (sigma-70 family)